MKHRTATVIATLCVALSLTSATARASAAKYTILADPDLQVSYDGDGSQMEGQIAASASDPNILVAESEVLIPDRSLMASVTHAYYSTDAGAEWTEVPLSTDGGWDNTIVGGTGGAAYFVTHDLVTDELTPYVTHDGGKTWSANPIKSPKWDREYAAVDDTDGKFAGRIYIAGQHSDMPGDGVYVLVSSDGGKSFAPPVAAYVPGGHWQASAQPTPVTLSDGTLIVPVNSYPLQQYRASWNLQNFGVVVSTDGGKTFSPYHSVGCVRRMLPTMEAESQASGDIVYGVNESFAVSLKSSAFPDRAYAAWETFDTPRREVVYVCHSDDHGATWSKPVLVDPAGAHSNADVRQAWPMAVVNKDGILAVAWFDGRNCSSARGGYDIYFAASANGGSTFLSATRISSATSHPTYGEASVPMMEMETPKAYERFWMGTTVRGRITQFEAPSALRSLGGDYATMAVDASGRFHPMWYDARDGNFRLYTCAVRVLGSDAIEQLQEDPPPTGKHVASLDDSVKVLYGAPQWDAVRKDVVYEVRLENLSAGTFTSPLHVKITNILSPGLLHDTGLAAARALWSAHAIYDPAAKRYVTTTDFVYPVSEARPLFPNSVTAAIPWRIHVVHPESAQFNLHIEVTGAGPETTPAAAGAIPATTTPAFGPQ